MVGALPEVREVGAVVIMDKDKIIEWLMDENKWLREQLTETHKEYKNIQALFIEMTKNTGVIPEKGENDV